MPEETDWQKANGWTDGQFYANVKEFFDKVYRDRGIMKWQGFFLSDHTSALQQQSQVLTTKIPQQEKQATEIVREKLEFAYANHRPVRLQLDQRNLESTYLPDVYGFVDGNTDNDEIFIDTQLIKISAIRHVAVVDFA